MLRLTAALAFLIPLSACTLYFDTGHDHGTVDASVVPDAPWIPDATDPWPDAWTDPWPDAGEWLPLDAGTEPWPPIDAGTGTSCDAEPPSPLDAGVPPSPDAQPYP